MSSRTNHFNVHLGPPAPRCTRVLCYYKKVYNKKAKHMQEQRSNPKKHMSDRRKFRPYLTLVGTDSILNSQRVKITQAQLANKRALTNG